MSKRAAPVTNRKEATLYLFIADAHLCLKIRAKHNKHSWGKNTLSMSMYPIEMSVAPYDGREHIVYFPAVKRYHRLEHVHVRHQDDCEAHYDAYLGLDFDGVTDLDPVDCNLDFKPLTVKQVLKLLRMPEPNKIDLNWRYNTYSKDNSSSLRCEIDMHAEGASLQDSLRAETLIDDFFGNLLETY